MRSVILAGSLLGLVCLSLAGPAAAADLDWKTWRDLPVLDGGRYKPLDTLAWETLRMIGNRSGYTDPETGRRLDATAWYLSMLFDWRAPEAPASGGHGGMGPHGGAFTNPAAVYFHDRQPDKWDRAPLILVDSLAVTRALGLPEGQKHIAPADLYRAEIVVPDETSDGGEKTRFLFYGQMLAQQRADSPKGFAKDATAFEIKAVELLDRLEIYAHHRMGRALAVAPFSGDDATRWLSIARLNGLKLDDAADPQGRLRAVRDQFDKARAAYLAGDAEGFREASSACVAAVRQAGEEQAGYPSPSMVALEVSYNHWAPFRIAWVLTLLAGLAVLASMGSGWKSFYVVALATFVLGVLAMLGGFAMRTAISGRAPVTNMYESVVYVGLGVAVLGLIFELVYRRRVILAAASAVTTIALILADNSPAVLSPHLQPLMPVLRNNFWLVVHVMTITLSYGAMALALGLGNITLGYYWKRTRDLATVRALSLFTYRTLQVGVVLLAAGTITGGIWAARSWGRFWGWDPKEVWALVALLGYLAVLHAAYVGWVGYRGLAALAIGCFALVVMAWYGVNYVLGAGLHSYGFGANDSHFYVGGALLLQFLYIGATYLNPASWAPELRAADGPPAASPRQPPVTLELVEGAG